MARGPSYRVPFRRRREGKTDYKARRSLIISRLPRIVARGSLKHMNVQIVEATPTGDKVITAAHSHELKDFGWKAATGNLPAAYLTGLLCGVRADAKNVKKAIADIGLHRPTKGARVFASLKGIIDGGIDIPHSSTKLPDDVRIKGKHIADYADIMASSSNELYEKMFSTYLRNKLIPKEISSNFDSARAEIRGKPKKPRTKARSKKPKAAATPRKSKARAKARRVRSRKKAATSKRKVEKS